MVTFTLPPVACSIFFPNWAVALPPGPSGGSWWENLSSITGAGAGDGAGAGVGFGAGAGAAQPASTKLLIKMIAKMLNTSFFTKFVPPLINKKQFLW
jgi:hypothetical protein